MQIQEISVYSIFWELHRLSYSALAQHMKVLSASYSLPAMRLGIQLSAVSNALVHIVKFLSILSEN